MFVMALMLIIVLEADFDFSSSSVSRVISLDVVSMREILPVSSKIGVPVVRSFLPYLFS